VADSRISLLFNAFVKVPLQFVILLTGAMVFTFFVFEQPPMLFNTVQRANMEQSADPAYASVESHYRVAFGDRREAARRLIENETAETGRAFRAADDRMQAARREGIALVEKRNGGESYNDTNYIFLNFVITYLPAGLVGLIIAAVFAAAMSTISAELNSLATATVVDHYRRYMRPNASDEHHTTVAKGATAFWGVYATIFASFGGQLGSLIEAVNIVGSLFYGSVLGVFVLAFAPGRANGHGAVAGMLAGLATVFWLHFSEVPVSFLWYNLVGCVVTVAVGLAVSAATGGQSRPAPAGPGAST
jgi:Na+(H+)/acetate symporter ActP